MSTNAYEVVCTLHTHHTHTPHTLHTHTHTHTHTHSPVNKPTPHGHVIACRITAENPDEVRHPSHLTHTPLTHAHTLHRDFVPAVAQYKSLTSTVVRMYGATSVYQQLVVSMSMLTRSLATALLGGRRGK